MKRTLFQLFNLLMVCIVLISSTGFGLVEHACQMRGTKKTTVLTFGDNKTPVGCAADGQTKVLSAKQTTVEKSRCCQNETKFENVEARSSLSQLVAKFIKIVTESVLAGVAAVIVYLFEWIFDRTSLSVSVTHLPVSPSGRDILTLVQRLLL